ncbi:MAG: trimeric intracellular cation channel family protein [Gemmatimonadaceae bacterium]
MLVYYFEIIGTAVFAITGVLSVTRRGLDVFGALVLGMVTALGGGTVRDLMIGAPIFWMADFNYVWAATAGALAAFWIGHFFRSGFRTLLYLDGLGAALFAVSAANKVLLLQLAGPIAVIMGVLTGIGGGLIRDVLAGRPTLLVSRDIYATPILLGCVIFVALRYMAPDFAYAGIVGFGVIFGLRACAIHWHLEMPAWLTQRQDPPE